MKDYLALAAMNALTSSRKGLGGPFGAVIVKGTRILAVAHNSVLQHNDPTCHAEINAIRLATRKLKSPFLIGCTVFSTTEPCPMCFAAIHWARVKKIVYSTTIADVKKLGFNELTISNLRLKRWGNSSVKIFRQKSLACHELLKAWGNFPKTKTY